jgi:putative transposase
VARCTVERIVGAQGWSNHKTTIGNETHPRYPDLVDRKFHAPAPNRLWVADFMGLTPFSGARSQAWQVKNRHAV